MDLLNTIEHKIIELIDLNSKLIEKVKMLSTEQHQLKDQRDQLLQENNETHRRLEKLLLTITEVEDVIQEASKEILPVALSVE
jgi:chromosome segregation ATPase